jgi:hypothetical protein
MERMKKRRWNRKMEKQGSDTVPAGERFTPAARSGVCIVYETE